MLDRRKNMAFTYLTVAVLAVLALYLWHRRNHPAHSLTDLDLAKEMQSRATQAVETAASEYGTVLDYSSASVVKVEEILGKIHEQHKSQPLSQNQVVKESLRWGGYIGEIIRRMKPCHWELNSAAGGESSFPIVFENEEHESFPIRWCYKRIKNGPEDNVWHKFSFAVSDDLEAPKVDEQRDSNGDRTAPKAPIALPK